MNKGHSKFLIRFFGVLAAILWICSFFINLYMIFLLVAALAIPVVVALAMFSIQNTRTPYSQWVASHNERAQLLKQEEAEKEEAANEARQREMASDQLKKARMSKLKSKR